MKTISVLLCCVATLMADAQPAREKASLESQSTARLGKAVARWTLEARPNETAKRGAVYSGIAVQLLKTANPLQLVNPAAPAQYGSPEDNVMRDSISGRVSGWKLFSIRF